MLADKGQSSFALPGGFVFITKGLVESAKNDDELAALLGHELAHLVLFHGMSEWNKRKIQRRSQDIFAELDSESDNMDGMESDLEKDFESVAADAFKHCTKGRSRSDEKEADLWGIALAVRAGYKPKALVDFFKRMKKENHPKFSLMPAPVSHFSLEKRITIVEDFLKKAGIN